MNCVGIVAEYNPFHNGHSYHIREAKRLTGAERAVVVMSGSFVQRGEPACADKFTRAAWALENGADMVIELPEVFSCACAERFAFGALLLLSGAGIVDSICFGSECGDIERLKRAAYCAVDPKRFSAALASGLSYPSAMASASDEAFSPNDILGVEYLRALSRLGSDIRPFALRRIGGYADAELCGEYSSAAAIRRALLTAGKVGCISPSAFDGLRAALPAKELEDIAELIRKGVFPASADRLSDAVLYRLRCMSAEEIAGLPEVSEGLENLFVRHAVSEGEYSRMLSEVKSKRYTMARLKRICMCAVLGVTEELQVAACEDEGYAYLRVLGVRNECTELLGELEKRASLPLIIRREDRNSLGEKALRVLRVSELAHRLHALARPFERGADDDAAHRLITV